MLRDAGNTSTDSLHTGDTPLPLWPVGGRPPFALVSGHATPLTTGRVVSRVMPATSPR